MIVPDTVLWSLSTWFLSLNVIKVLRRTFTLRWEILPLHCSLAAVVGEGRNKRIIYIGKLCLRFWWFILCIARAINLHLKCQKSCERGAGVRKTERKPKELNQTDRHTAWNVPMFFWLWTFEINGCDALPFKLPFAILLLHLRPPKYPQVYVYIHKYIWSKS